MILSVRNNRIRVPILFTYNAVDFVLVFAGFILIALNFVDSSLLQIEILKYCFSFVILFFLPGWIVVRLLKISDKFRKIPILVISFSISVAITSIIYTIVLILMVEPSGLIISITYSALSLIPIVLRYTAFKKSYKSIFVKNRKKDYNLVEIITLVWITSFFVFSILYIYPEMVNTPWYDIVRHYASVSVINDHADLFRSPYPWFHLSLAALNDVTESEMWVFQTANSFISIILILAFYSMAKAYLYKFNKYAHLLATIVFTGFTGLGWIFYYQNIEPIMSLNEHFSLLSNAYTATYFDIGLGQSQWLWLWFRPITIDFILTLSLFFLMRTENLNRLTYLILSSFFIITLSLVHFPGVVLIVLVIFILAIFVPKIKLRIKDMALSLIISLPVAASVFMSYVIIFGSDYVPFKGTHMIILECISIASFLLLVYTKRVHIPINLNYKRVISVFLAIYGILFIYWLTNIDAIKYDISRYIVFPGGLFSVPISIFPELLGLAGLLSIPIIVIVIKNNRNNPLLLFPVVFIFMLIIGKIISYVIINIQETGYWERRLVPYTWIAVSILSPIAIFKISNYINGIKSAGKNLVIRKRLITVLFVFFLVMGSMMSSFLTLEYQRAITSQSKVSDNEKALLDEVKKLDPHSTILSLTPRSKSLAEFQLFNYNVGEYRDQIWPSLSPEMPMNIVNGLNSTAIVYLNNQDIDKIIENRYNNGYMASHVLENAQEIQKNSNFGKIIQIPRLSPPTSASDMVLILPNEISRSQYYAYDILSYGQYNFTTALLADISTIKEAKILVAPNEEIANTIIDFKKAMDLSFENLIILNLDGYGKIGQIEGDFMGPRLDHKDFFEYENSYANSYNNAITYSRQYSNPVNLSEYDSIKIDWVGQGTYKDHTIRFSSDSNGIIEYKFNDWWKGPKQLLLPMNLTDIDSGFSEINVQRAVINNASWSEISKISIIKPDSFTDFDPSVSLNNFLFISESKGSSIESIYSNESIKLNQSSIIPSNYPSSYKPLATFDNNIPFILQNKEQDYNIFYINIFTLLRNFHDNNFSSAEMYSIYGKLLDWLGVDIPIYKSIEKSPLDLVEGGIGAFSKGAFNGNVTLQSTSAIINTNTVKSKINVDGVNSDIENLLQIVPLNVDQVKIKSNSSIISGIYGFYANSFSPHKTVLNFTGNPSVLSIIYNNNEERRINGSDITIELDNANIISRQPKIMVNGVSDFIQFYAYGELGDKIGAIDIDLKVIGESNFDIRYADKFIMIEKAQLTGKYETGWTKFFRDDGDAILLDIDDLIKRDTIVYSLLLVSLCCIYNLYLTRRKK
jgi:hypothetical protein